MGGLRGAPRNGKLRWFLMLGCCFVQCLQAALQPHQKDHSKFNSLKEEVDPEDLYSIDIIQINHEPDEEDFFPFKHERRHKSRWHPVLTLKELLNKGFNESYSEAIWEEDIGSRHHRLLNQSESKWRKAAKTKNSRAKHTQQHRESHEKRKRKHQSNSRKAAAIPTRVHSRSHHKGCDSKSCAQLRWRSRKTRRHDRIPAFINHRRHYDQELEKEKEPFFDLSTPSVVMAQVATSAFLPCRIHNIGDKSVSWIRNKDAHILTVDRYTFISDARFVSLFEPETETWTLQLKFVEKNDSGSYECQVTTEPKMSRFVDLHVIVPHVVIPGGAELHVRSGSDVNLKCVISRALSPPPHVFWYHEERQVIEGSRGGMVQQAPLESVSKDSSVASLTIRSARKSHAGNYTCTPAGLKTAASIILHVLNGEHPAAMQHGINLAPDPRTQFGTTIVILYFLYAGCKMFLSLSL